MTLCSNTSRFSLLALCLCTTDRTLPKAEDSIAAAAVVQMVVVVHVPRGSPGAIGCLATLWQWQVHKPRSRAIEGSVDHASNRHGIAHRSGTLGQTAAPPHTVLEARVGKATAVVVATAAARVENG
jgi:hypothetical protein